MELTASKNDMRPRYLSVACPRCGKRIFGFKSTGDVDVQMSCPKCNETLKIVLASNAISIAVG